VLLGISAVYDRIAQTVVCNLFEKQVEPDFHPDSYAYRRSKSVLDAVRVTQRWCWRYNWVLELVLWMKSYYPDVPCVRYPDDELMHRPDARSYWVTTGNR
jgi:hypothetical protein